MPVVQEPQTDPNQLRHNIERRCFTVLGAGNFMRSTQEQAGTGMSPSSFSQGPKDEWDRRMKENYEQGGVLKELSERGREDYQTGNTFPLP